MRHTFVISSPACYIMILCAVYLGLCVANTNGANLLKQTHPENKDGSQSLDNTIDFVEARNQLSKEVRPLVLYIFNDVRLHPDKNSAKPEGDGGKKIYEVGKKGRDIDEYKKILIEDTKKSLIQKFDHTVNLFEDFTQNEDAISKGWTDDWVFVGGEYEEGSELFSPEYNQRDTEFYQNDSPVENSEISKDVFLESTSACRHVNGYYGHRFLRTVVMCPEHWTNATVRARCEGRAGTVPVHQSIDDVAMLPVQDSLGTVYRNVHCGLCHHASLLHPWSTVWECSSVRDNPYTLLAHRPSNLSFLRTLAEKASCNRAIVPSLPQAIEACQPHHVFKGDYSRSNPLQALGMPSSFPVNFNVLMNFDFSGDTHILFSAGQQVLQNEYVRRCSVGETFDTYSKKCRPIKCSSSHRLQGSNCVPLEDSAQNDSHSQEFQVIPDNFDISSLHETAKISLSVNISFGLYLIFKEERDLNTVVVEQIAENLNISSSRIKHVNVSFDFGTIDKTGYQVQKLSQEKYREYFPNDDPTEGTPNQGIPTKRTSTQRTHTRGTFPQETPTPGTSTHNSHTQAQDQDIEIAHTHRRKKRAAPYGNYGSSVRPFHHSLEASRNVGSPMHHLDCFNPAYALFFRECRMFPSHISSRFSKLKQGNSMKNKRTLRPRRRSMRGGERYVIRKDIDRLGRRKSDHNNNYKILRKELVNKRKSQSSRRRVKRIAAISVRDLSTEAKLESLLSNFAKTPRTSPVPGQKPNHNADPEGNHWHRIQRLSLGHFQTNTSSASNWDTLWSLLHQTKLSEGDFNYRMSRNKTQTPTAVLASNHNQTTEHEKELYLSPPLNKNNDRMLLGSKSEIDFDEPMAMRISFILSPPKDPESDEEEARLLVKKIGELITDQAFTLLVSGNEVSVVNSDDREEDERKADEFCPWGVMFIVYDNEFKILEIDNVTMLYVNRTRTYHGIGRFDLWVMVKGQNSAEETSVTNMKEYAFVCFMPRITQGDCQRIDLTRDEYHVMSENRSIVFEEREYNITTYTVLNETTGDIEICVPQSYEADSGQILPHFISISKGCSAEFDDVRQAEGYLTLVLGRISIAAQALVLITYFLFPQLRNLPGCNIMNLTLALFIAETIFEEGMLVGQHWRCITVAITLHFFFLASHFWMSVMSFDVYRAFSKPNASTGENEKKAYFLKYFLYAWGMPALIVCVCAFIEFSDVFYNIDIGYGGVDTQNTNSNMTLTYSTFLFSEQESITKEYVKERKDTVSHNITFTEDTLSACWIQNPLASLIAFGAPILLIFVTNCMFFIKTILTISKTVRLSNQQLHRNDSNNSSHRQTSGRSEAILYLRMSTVMGFTWVFGFSSAIISSVASPTTAICVVVHAHSILFIICNISQGLFIFVAFVCNRRVLRLYTRLFGRVRQCLVRKAHKSSVYSISSSNSSISTKTTSVSQIS